jgi:hypothetical protein
MFLFKSNKKDKMLQCEKNKPTGCLDARMYGIDRGV